jgi:hypothetical protein
MSRSKVAFGLLTVASLLGSPAMAQSTGFEAGAAGYTFNPTGLGGVTGAMDGINPYEGTYMAFIRAGQSGYPERDGFFRIFGDRWRRGEHVAPGAHE